MRAKITRREALAYRSQYKWISKIETKELRKISYWTKLIQHAVLAQAAPLFRKPKLPSASQQVLNRWLTLQEKMLG